VTDLTPEQADALAMAELLHLIMGQRDDANLAADQAEESAFEWQRTANLAAEEAGKLRLQIAELELLRKAGTENLVAAKDAADMARKAAQEHRNVREVLERQVQEAQALAEDLGSEREGVDAVLESVADELEATFSDPDKSLDAVVSEVIPRLRQASRSQPPARSELAQDVPTGGKL
jgi:chromosome segregation ATPase